MVVVAMTAVIILLGFVDKLLVWDTSIINIVVVVEVLAIGVLADVEIIVLGVILIVLKFAAQFSIVKPIAQRTSTFVSRTARL